MLCGDDSVNSDGCLGFWVYPEVRVMPIVSELDLHEVSAPRASRSVDLEDCAWTSAGAS